MMISTRRFVLPDALLQRIADLAIARLTSLIWPKIPERAGVGGATGDCVRVKAVTLQTKRLHSSSRRALGRPSSDEMPLEPVGRRRQPSGAFGGDFLRGLGVGGFHCALPCCSHLAMKSKMDCRWKSRQPFTIPGFLIEMLRNSPSAAP